MGQDATNTPRNDESQSSNKTSYESSFDQYLVPMESTPESRRRLMMAGLVAGTTVFGTLALIAPFVFTRSPLPYMATPSQKVRQALKHLADNGHERGLFVDLGSGDGEAVKQAVQMGYRRAVGVELNVTLYALAQIRRLFFWTRDERARSNFYCRNLFDYSIKEADAVFFFGVTPLLIPISEKIAKECRAGTHVLAYRFPLPLSTKQHGDGDDGDESETETPYAKLVYDEEEMRIYQCLGADQDTDITPKR
jgi:hypothetical protein